MKLNLAENSNSKLQRELLDALPVLVFLECAGQIVFANAEARQLLGYTEDDWTPQAVEEVLWGLSPGTAEPQTQILGSLCGSPFHATVATRAGHLIAVEGNYSVIRPGGPDAVIVAQTAARGRAPKSELMEDVLACLPEAVAITHGSHVLFTNAAFTRMFGYTADEAGGNDLRDLIVPETRQHENTLLLKMVDQQGCGSMETVRMRKDAELVDVAVQVAVLMVAGEKAGLIATYRSLGDRKAVEATIQLDAMRDIATGLPNRALFEDHVQLALMRRQRRRDQGCGVLIIHLDNAALLHSTLGHAGQNALIAAFGQVLTVCMRPQDTAGRLGPHQFGVLVENIFHAGDLDVVATRILKRLERPFEIIGHSFAAKASIGAAMAGQDNVAVESLMRDAEFAMFHARQSAGRKFEVFDRHMGVSLNTLQERERQLRTALANRRFEVWYEPVYRLANGRLEALESHLRLHREGHGLENYRDLLPAAEETGLSISVGRQVLETVCGQSSKWVAAGATAAITVNLTHRQFFHDDMVALLKRTLEASGADPSHILLEIGESTVNQNPDVALSIMQRMSDCGVRLALDDFGAGLSALNHLVRLPIELVKMDAMLTMAVTQRGRQLALVESVIHLGKSVGVQVVAQGIESHEQLVALRSLGCELGQGALLRGLVDSARALTMAVGDTQSFSAPN